ncbi:MAG TPA: hypothetical protein VFL14_00750 [Xanthomonadales bacterium]|nr:hypothetical protein [Xanthomonadales bacterium]
MRHEAYRIEDEPRPGALAAFAVSPVWPLLGLMFVGNWFGLAWFAFNGIAVGSPTLRRELLLIAVGIAGAFAIVLAVAWAASSGLIERGMQVELALLALVLWKLGVGYFLHAWQSATIEIHEHYGGVLRNGLPIVIVATLLPIRKFVGELPTLVAMVLQ